MQKNHDSRHSALCSLALPTLSWILIGTLTNGWAQSTLFDFAGSAERERAGYSLDHVGDINADGVDDFIVGVDEFGGDYRGKAYVLSGLDGAVLWENSGSPLSWYGQTVAGAGDVDGDGLADFMVGAPYDGAAGIRAGRVAVYSGLNGSEILAITGAAAYDFAGWALDGIGDINGDGHADLIITNRISGSFWFRVNVHSGFDGAVLFSYETVGLTGTVVRGVDDVDADGVPDFAMQRNTGVDVFSGQTGSRIYNLESSSYGDEFGAAFDAAGDVNGDGFGDILIGAPGFLLGGEMVGRAVVISGQDGSILLELRGSVHRERLGRAVAGIGDEDGDGVPDLLVSGYQLPGTGVYAGHVKVFSGANGQLTATIDGPLASDRFGSHISYAGDVSGDGHADFLVAARNHDTTEWDAGRVLLLSARDVVGDTYCVATVNSTGSAALIRAAGSSRVAFNDLVLRAGPVPNQTGIFFYGLTQVQVPFGNGYRCAGGTIQRLSPHLAQSQLLEHVLDNKDSTLAGMEIVSGATFHFQAWYRDPGVGAGFNLSDGLSVLFTD